MERQVLNNLHIKIFLAVKRALQGLGSPPNLPVTVISEGDVREILMNFSLARHTRHVTGMSVITIDELVKRIRNGTNGLVQKTAEVRQLHASGDVEGKREFKLNHLPAVVPAGVFEKRNTKGLTEHSGLVCLDFDHTACAAELFAKSTHMQTTVLAFISPSGDGVKVFVRVTPKPTNAEEHTIAYETVVDAYSHLGDVDADKQCKNLDRLCYLAHDPYVFCDAEREEAVTWAMPTLPEAKPTPKPAPQTAVTQERLTERDVDALLRDVPHADDYERWMQVGMILKSEGYTQTTWDSWSSSSAKFDQAVNDAKWESFGDSNAAGKSVGLGSLIKWANDNRPYVTRKPAPAPVVQNAPEPVVVDEPDIAPPPKLPEFPKWVMDGGFLGDVREAYAGRNEVCLPFQFASVITTLGAVMGRSVFLEGTFPIYPNIYSVLLGDTSISRKSTAKDFCMEHMRAAMPDDGSPEIRMNTSVDTGEGIVNVLATHAAVTLGSTDDEGAPIEWDVLDGFGALPDFEGIRLAIFQDEMRALFNKRTMKSNSLVARLTEAYSTPSEMSNRSKTASQLAKYPTVSLMGCSTLSWFEKGLVTEDIEGGFANRFMYFLHEQMPYVAFPEPIDGSKMSGFLNHISELRKNWVDTHHKFTISEAIKQRFAEIYTAMMDELKSNKDVVKNAAVARWQTHLMKLALIFQLLDGKVGEDAVTMESWMKAEAVSGYLTEVNQHVFSNIVSDELAEGERRVLNVIEKKGIVTRREIGRAINPHTMSAEAVTRALEQLVKAEKVKPNDGGRTIRYTLT